MSYCNKCGKENIDSAKFCTGCGNSLINIQRYPIPEPGSTTKKKSNLKWLLIGLTAVILLTATYILFFRNSGEERIMMVIPESLKLRSTMSDAADNNILSSAGYGAKIKILDSSGTWYKVEYNGQDGFMHSRYLCSSRDFCELNAIIQTAGPASLPDAEKISESRFKKSILNYFRTHNYIGNIATEQKEKYFTKEELNKKETWRIKTSSPGTSTILKGYFTYSDKKGIAIIIENAADPARIKLIIFNYSSDETETMVSEFDVTNLQNIWLGQKGVDYYTDFNGYTYILNYDAVFCNINSLEIGYIPFYIFRNGKMENEFDYQYGD